MDLENKFLDAQQRSKKLDHQSNNNLLDLYSLYKQATEGDIKGNRPGMFDLKGAAKYDAWNLRQGMLKEEAMESYIELVNRLESESQI